MRFRLGLRRRSRLRTFRLLGMFLFHLLCLLLMTLFHLLFLSVVVVFLGGLLMLFFLLLLKLFTRQHVMDQHGPLFVIAGVLILAGIQMLAIGLLGELQVRHYHTATQRAPYTIDRLVRLRSPEEPSLLQEN